MQGADTNAEDVGKIREALQEGKGYCGRLLNYKKDGTPFWNLLTISPIKDEDGNTLKFIGYVNVTLTHTEAHMILQEFYKFWYQHSMIILIYNSKEKKRRGYLLESTSSIKALSKILSFQHDK